MKKRIALILVAALMLAMLAGCDSADYKEAMALYEGGNYLEAAAMFESLGNYEDSAEQARNSKYQYAQMLFADARYEEAIAAYEVLEDYKDCKDCISECKYLIAEALFQEGNYTDAIAAYEEVSGYKDANAKIEEAEQQMMYALYAPVFAALDGQTWFYASTSVNEVKSLTFTQDKVTQAYIFYDGNGPHSGMDGEFSYAVNDAAIVVSTMNGEMEIPYTMDGDQIVLGAGDYFTPQQVEEALQGYWGLADVTYNMFTGFVSSEYVYYFENGNVTFESATAAYGGGGYYYYGPYEGTYTVDANGLTVDAKNNWQFGFLISEGEVVMTRCGNLCSPASGFKGEDGYSF